MGGAKMHLRHLPKHLGAVFLDQLSRHVFHRRRNAAPKLHAERFAPAVEPIDELLASDDLRRGHGEIRLRFGPLVELDGAAALPERAFDDARVGEFVR